MVDQTGARLDSEWPCRKRSRDEQCDSAGLGGFMGHTCHIAGRLYSRRFEEHGVVSLEMWPEGLMLWARGSIAWRSWQEDEPGLTLSQCASLHRLHAEYQTQLDRVSHLRADPDRKVSVTVWAAGAHLEYQVPVSVLLSQEQEKLLALRRQVEVCGGRVDTDAVEAKAP